MSTPSHSSTSHPAGQAHPHVSALTDAVHKLEALKQRGSSIQPHELDPIIAELHKATQGGAAQA